MRKLLLATALLFGGSALALAQGAGTEPPTRSDRITAEQRTTIRQYVTTHRIAPVRMSQGVAVGAVLPADVELAAAPSEWGPSFSTYRYVYSGDNVYLVEPQSRRVMHVID